MATPIDIARLLWNTAGTDRVLVAVAAMLDPGCDEDISDLRAVIDDEREAFDMAIARMCEANR